MKLERSVSHPAAHLNPKATLDREAERNARITKHRGEEDKFTPIGSGDDDDEEVEKVAFQSSGSSHQLAIG